MYSFLDTSYPRQGRLTRWRRQGMSAMNRFRRVVEIILDTAERRRGRVAKTDVGVEAVTVPSGDTVFALLSSANRDERDHNEPDRLDVTREGPPHLAFGMGPHLCIGAPLARVELQEALAGILRRFPRMRLAVPESELVWKEGNIIRGVRTLPVTW